MQKLIDFELKAKYLRKTAFETVINAGKGHLGGSLSSTEILVALYYGGILHKEDKFILSKGHSNNVLHVILADLGFFAKAALLNYTKDGSMLGGHCDPLTPGVEIVSGSLGHGLGVGCGIAFGAKLDNSGFMTYVLLGDGECQEGSVWEAVAFAAHHKLNNIIAIVDRNLLGAEDFTENTCKLGRFESRWESFEWDVAQVHGHSVLAIAGALKIRGDKPRVIIANTIKGKGISSLEGLPKSHHTVPTGIGIPNALKELA
jgi:transketolase